MEIMLRKSKPCQSELSFSIPGSLVNYRFTSPMDLQS